MCTGLVLNLGLCSKVLTTTDPSHGMASTCLMPQYDDMKPKLKRNKSAIIVCLGVVLMAHALNVGGPGLNHSQKLAIMASFVFHSPQMQVH